MRFPSLPPVVKNLLIINVIIFAAGALVPALEMGLQRYGAIHYFTSPGFLPTQLLTYMFIHGNFTHLFFNMFALWMFGGIIERTLGSTRFLFYYISCGIFAALVQLGAYGIAIHHYASLLPDGAVPYITTHGWEALQQGLNFSNPTEGILNLLINGPMVGASGAIYGIILAFGMLYPNQPVFLFFIPVPIKAKWIVIGYGILELIQGLGMNTADNVAHFAHLGGMIAGVMLILYWKKKGIFNNHWFF